MLISVYNNIWLHLLSILTNIVSFWYPKKCHFMDIIDKKCQFYVYKLTIMDTGTISHNHPEFRFRLKRKWNDLSKVLVLVVKKPDYRTENAFDKNQNFAQEIRFQFLKTLFQSSPTTASPSRLSLALFPASLSQPAT